MRELSLVQERMWLFDQLFPKNNTQCYQMILHIHGALDVGAFKTALSAFFDRHEILRSKFVAGDNRVEAVPVDKQAPKEFDLAEYDATKKRKIIEGLKKNLLDQPIDVTASSASREALIRYEEDRFLFVLVCHHLAFDAASARILASEISHIYNAEVLGDPVELDPDPPQYFTHAEEENAGSDLADSMEFWRTTLAQPLPKLNLATSRTRPEKSALLANWTNGEFDAATVSRIKQIASSGNTTVYTVLMALFGLALCSEGNQDEVIVSFPSSNRTTKEHEDIVGPMFNPVAVRIERDDEESFDGAVARVSNSVRLAISHQGHAFEAVSREIRATQENASAPLYQAMLLYYADQPLTLPMIDLDCRLEPIEIRPSGLDFCLYLEEVEGKIEWRMQFDAEIYGEVEANSIVSTMQNFLGNTADNLRGEEMNAIND